MIKLEAPFTEEKIRQLKVGDMVEITGKLFTGRDAVHKYLHEGGALPISLKDQIVYHCGPVVVKKGGRWKMVAAGPTTSIREEPYQADIIKNLGLRAVIGKGGMGDKTRKACQENGCVYLHAIGGAAQVLAEMIESVDNVYLFEKFGSPEAVWEITVKNFPVVVTIDAHGQSLHSQVLETSQKNLASILGRPNT